MQIEQLADTIAIQQLLYRYCRGVDRGDRALIASVYHADARDDHGGFKGLGSDFANWIVDAMDQNRMIGQHHITNMLIEVDGDVAHGESYFLAFHPDAVIAGEGDVGGEGLSFSGGRYLDRFEKRGGAWRIADRRVVFDWSRAPEPPSPWSAATGALHGARRADDISHGFVTRAKFAEAV